jgi:hypothetical protein
MSPTAAVNNRVPLRALVCSVALLGGLTSLIAGPVQAAPPASPAAPPAKLSAKQLPKAKAPAKKRNRGARSAHGRLRAVAYNHLAGTGGLWCEPNRSRIAVGHVVAQVHRGETLYTRASLFRWTGSRWTLEVSGRTVWTRDPYVSQYTSWSRLDGLHDWDGSGQAFNIGLRGRYWAIARDMWWTDTRGNVVDRHYAWATDAADSFYCYV